VKDLQPEDHRVRPGDKVDVNDLPTRYEGPIDKEEGQAEFARLSAELVALQQTLYAEGKRSLLVVLQAMDAAGKDSTVRHVFIYGACTTTRRRTGTSRCSTVRTTKTS